MGACQRTDAIQIQWPGILGQFLKDLCRKSCGAGKAQTTAAVMGQFSGRRSGYPNLSIECDGADMLGQAMSRLRRNGPYLGEVQPISVDGELFFLSYLFSKINHVEKTDYEKICTRRRYFSCYLT